MTGLIAYDWPGNVRELKNLVEATFIASDERSFSMRDLPHPYGEVFARLNEEAISDRRRLLAALVAVKWNKACAARRLGCSRMTLYRRLAKYGIQQADS
jgi:transcriptional regulator of acetoin/glycerol metabolism